MSGGAGVRSLNGDLRRREGAYLRVFRGQAPVFLPPVGGAGLYLSVDGWCHQNAH